MRTITTVFALLLSVTAAAADAGDATAGKTVYAGSCARCHRDAAQIAGKIPGTTATEKTDWLADFLPTHHLTKPDGQADLIAYLLSL